MKIDVNTGYSIRRILDDVKNGMLLTDHILQREANQWKKKEKSLLIDSILRGVAIKSITIQLETPDVFSKRWLLDGKQRVSVICDFYGEDGENGFALSRSLDPIDAQIPKMVQETDENGEPVYEKVGRKTVPKMVVEKDEKGHIVYEIKKIELKNKTFKDLPQSLKDKFLNYTYMPVVELTNCTKEEVQRQILRENISAKMNGSQIGTVLSGEEIASFTKSFRTCPLFTNTEDITPNDINKGLIERLVCESIMLMEQPDSWGGYETMALKFNEIITNDVKDYYCDLVERLTRILDTMNASAGNVYREWIHSKNIYIILANFKNFADYEDYPDAVYERFLTAWFQSIRANTEYADFDLTSTKGKKSVLARFEIMNEALETFLDENGDFEDSEAPEDTHTDFEMKANDDALADYITRFDNTVLATRVEEEQVENFAVRCLMMTTDSPYHSFSVDRMAQFVEWFSSCGETGKQDMIENCLRAVKDLGEYSECLDEDDRLLSIDNMPLLLNMLKEKFPFENKFLFERWLGKFSKECTYGSSFAREDFYSITDETTSGAIISKKTMMRNSIDRFLEKERERTTLR